MVFDGKMFTGAEDDQTSLTSSSTHTLMFRPQDTDICEHERALNVFCSIL